jgi:hypothetical protein
VSDRVRKNKKEEFGWLTYENRIATTTTTTTTIIIPKIHTV